MSDLTQIEQRLSRLEALIQPNDEFDDRRLVTAQVARRYGVTVDTIKNWRKDPRKNFPPAEIDPSGRKYNWLSQLREYDERDKQANEVF